MDQWQEGKQGMQDLEYELRGMVRRASRTAYGTRAARRMSSCRPRGHCMKWASGK